jgi:DNA-binding MarR family transcriptional regulator
MGAHAVARDVGQSTFSRRESETRLVLDNLRLLVRALRVSARVAEKAVGISGAQLFVLQTLRDARVASIGELASVVVDRLARRRLVAREASKLDARRVEIRLTPAGRSLLRRSPESTQSGLIAGVKRMPREMRQQLGAALGELAQAMGISGEPRMFFEDETSSARGTRKNARA